MIGRHVLRFQIRLELKRVAGEVLRKIEACNIIPDIKVPTLPEVIYNLL